MRQFATPPGNDRRRGYLAACGFTGILGVLGEAATRGLIELAPAIDRLRMTNFRSSPALLKATLDRFAYLKPSDATHRG
ncbi:MAG: DUF3368 domain-containing protein [Acidobacteria bacterium]|nr:DUF3368 domain-containing protein [Acidobacteriota bacterium]